MRLQALGRKAAHGLHGCHPTVMLESLGLRPREGCALADMLGSCFAAPLVLGAAQHSRHGRAS